MNNWSILRYSSIVRTILCNVCRSSEFNNLRKDQWKRAQDNCPFLPTAPYFSLPYSQFQTNPNMIQLQHHKLYWKQRTHQMRSGDKTILASFANPCSNNNSPFLPASSVPLCLTLLLPYLPLPQAEWKGVTVLGLTLPTWCQREEEKEVAGEVPRGHIVVLEYV